MVIFYNPFILLCIVKQAELVKTVVSINPNLDFSKSTRHTNTGMDIWVVSELCKEDNDISTNKLTYCYRNKGRCELNMHILLSSFNCTSFSHSIALRSGNKLSSMSLIQYLVSLQFG